MAGRARSETQKKRQKSDERQEQYAKAMRAHQNDQEKPKAARRSIAALAQEFEVDNTTLGRYINDGVPITSFNASKRKLDAETERVVLDFILKSSDQRLPPTHREIEQLVKNTCQSCSSR